VKVVIFEALRRWSSSSVKVVIFDTSSTVMHRRSSHPVIIYSTPPSSLPGEQRPENIKRAQLEWDRRNSLEGEWLGPAKLQRGEDMRMCAEDADQIHMEMARLEQVEKKCVQALQPPLRERRLESKQKLYLSFPRASREER
jgi:hypothetical protein